MSPKIHDWKPVYSDKAPYDNCIVFCYEGTNVGKIYLSDIEDVVGNSYVTWGVRFFLDRTEPAVEQSLKDGILRYFCTEKSSQAFESHGAPFIAYDMVRRK